MTTEIDERFEKAYKELGAFKNGNEQWFYKYYINENDCGNRWLNKEAFRKLWDIAIAFGAQAERERVLAALPSESEFIDLYDEEYGDECKATSLYNKIRQRITRALEDE